LNTGVWTWRERRNAAQSSFVYKTRYDSPSVSITSLTNNTAFTERPDVLSGLTSDTLSGKGSVDLTVGISHYSPVVQANGTFSVPGTAFIDGTNSIVAQAYDVAGNHSLTSIKAFFSPLIICSDINADGKDEIAVNYGQGGIWIKSLSGWSQLHGTRSVAMAAGQFDSVAAKDVMVNFGDLGVWKYLNRNNWEYVTYMGPERWAVGDIDGDSKDEAVIDFGDVMVCIFIICC